eukprot:3195251-Rhodomonas_salina.1
MLVSARPTSTILCYEYYAMLRGRPRVPRAPYCPVSRAALLIQYAALAWKRQHYCSELLVPGSEAV